MAGFFGLFDYNKEGPGVYLNEPPKGPFKTFFAVLGRKFWKVITVNMMYVMFSIPVLIFAWLVGSQIFPAILPILSLESLEKFFTAGISSSTSGAVSQAASSVSQAISNSASQVSGAVSEVVTLSPKETAAILFSQINMVLSFSLIGLQLIVLGPVHAGITYIFRNYAREEHAFIWGDFREHLMKNWKQSSVTGLLGLLAVIVVSVNFSFYTDNSVISNGFLKGILTGAVIVISLVFTIMQMYIYPMMVTFKLTLKQLYKNSALLTMAKLPQNIGILLISLIIILVIPMALITFIGGLGIVLGIFYYFFIGFGLNLMVTNFFVYRQLRKYMIEPTLAEAAKAEEASINTEAEPQEEPIFRDTAIDDDQEKEEK
ncbi:MAG: YesL family protein [Saccharofermentanales bacterium]